MFSQMTLDLLVCHTLLSITFIRKRLFFFSLMTNNSNEKLVKNEVIVNEII